MNMTKVTVYFDKDTIESLLTKMENRLSDAKLVSNPHRGKSKNDLKTVAFDKIAGDVGAYLKRRSGKDDDVADHAFVFGEVLNDTVFMLTPVTAVGGQVVSHEFDIEALSRNSYEYSIDFYERI